MASVRRKPGTRFWVCCYTDHEGAQRQRSSRTTNRGEAQKLAEAYESAYRKRMSETQVRRVMADIFQDLHGESLCHYTLDQWLTTWLERVKPEVSPTTYASYQLMASSVRRLAPMMCAAMLDQVERQQILEFRSALAAGRSASTTNHQLKILRQCLKVAWMDSLIPENPAARVPNVRADVKEEGESRRPFTVEELSKLLGVADDEWRGMIFAGLYTAGQRLSDIATMTAGQVDLEAKIVRFRTDKTGRDVIVPIVTPWLADLKKRVAGKSPTHRLFPRAYGRYVARNGNVGGISNSFRRLLFRVGLALNPSYAREGAVAGRRKQNPLSFHSFRHTATSMLKNLGVSDSVVMDIVGHESEAVSRNYTHIDDATKRAALEKLPALVNPARR